MAHRRTCALVLAITINCGLVAATAADAAADGAHHVPPVDAPVTEAFRAPTSPYGPGNRGLGYDLNPGTDVRASAPGDVVFAGPVAGTLHVTVLHADGLRTSYSFLEALSVRRGQTVERGTVVGTAGAGFHFGVRDGDAYLDPAALFAAVEVRVRLVPHDEPLPPTDAGLLRERIALRAVVAEERPGLLERAWRWTTTQAGRLDRAVRDHLPLVHQLDPSRRAVELARSITVRLQADCTDSGTPVPADPAGDRTAVLVAGIGSTSAKTSIDAVDTAALGYADADVVRYSYAGGRIPDDDDLTPGLAAIPARSYGAGDTLHDLVAEGQALADLIEDAAAARPGVPVDVIAHSQGGIVTRLAVSELERRSGGLDALGTVVTIGTPHGGADLATVAVTADAADHAIADAVRWAIDVDVDPDSTAVLQLAEGSPVIERLAEEGVPDDVAFRTIGARGDLVVPGNRTSVDGHPSAMVRRSGLFAHSDLPGEPSVTRELGLALAGLAPACRGVVDTVLDVVTPELISVSEDLAGLTLAVT